MQIGNWEIVLMVCLCIYASFSTLTHICVVCHVITALDLEFITDVVFLSHKCSGAMRIKILSC